MAHDTDHHGIKPPPLDWLPDAIREHAPERRLEAGETLFRQGEHAAAIFGVAEGRLRLIRSAGSDRSVVLHTAQAGEFLAEAALFAGAYQCDAVAAVDSRVRVYSKRDLVAALRRDPDLAARFMAVLSQQLHALRTRLEERNIRSARERLLHHLALATGADGRTVRLTGTVMDLAADLGLTHEVVYRTLAALAKDGVIARPATDIIVLAAPAI